jgi:riboflavin synthase
MFTGIIEQMGRISAVRAVPSGVRLVVDPVQWSYIPAVGDSVAVNGCCLTIAAPPQPGLLTFDVIPETLDKTTLGSWRVGDAVNLERAATMSTLLGGHLVQGHVDGVGEVVHVVRAGAGAPDRWGEHRVRVRLPASLAKYAVPKGSIAVDGVSLTIAAVEPRESWFEIALIPTTLDKTTLGRLKQGDRCNIEADAMAKAIVHYMEHFGLDKGRTT